MENEGLPKTASDLCNVSHSLSAHEAVLGDGNPEQLVVSPAIEMRNSSTELSPPTKSIALGAPSTSHSLPDHLLDRNVILSVIRALHEKQRTDGTSEVGYNTALAESVLKGDRTRSGLTFNKDANLLASVSASLQPSIDASMQLPGDASVQPSRNSNMQPDLSIKWSRDVNIQPIRDPSLLQPRDPKVIPPRDVASLTSRDVRFQPTMSAKTMHTKDTSYLPSGEVSFQSSRSANSKYFSDVSMQAFRDKTPDVGHSSKRRKATLSDRDGGDSSDSSSRELFTGRTTSTAFISQLSHDIARRHTDSPSSSCSSSLSAASSPGPNSAHSGDLLHRFPKVTLDINGGGVSSSSGEDVFKWAHSMMSESSSGATNSGTSSSSKRLSEKSASTSQVDFPPRHVSPKSFPPSVLPESSSSRVSVEFAPQKVSPELQSRSIPQESSPSRVPPESASYRALSEFSHCRVLPESSPRTVPPESSPRRVPLESSSRRIPLESSPRRVPLESSPRRVPLESSPRRVPLESSPRRVPLESSPRRFIPDSSPRRVPPESSPCSALPPECSPRRVLPDPLCKINPESCVAPQSSAIPIPLESSPRLKPQESSPRCVFPDFSKSPPGAGSSPTPLSTNTSTTLTKLNFDTSSSDSMPSKFEQPNGRANERCRIQSPEKSPSFASRATSSCSADQRSTSGSPRNQARGQSLEPGATAQIDTTQMTVDEILQFIRVPKFSNHKADNDKLKEFLDPHEIGHMNHLIKCFSDAIFSVTFPENIVGKNGYSPLDVLDLYCCSIIRLYHLSFKNLDFINLQPDDQLALLKNFALKGILCMAFFIFKEETNSWVYPTGLYHQKLLEVKVADVNQLLPYSYLQRILAMNVIGAKLGIDWPMGMLLIGAFFYCPIDVEIQDIEKIDKLRDRYMEILFKYLKWKHGSSNASLCFPEILKLMDAVLKQCSELEHQNLALKEDEVKALEERIKSLSASCQSDKCDEEGRESPVVGSFTDGVTFSKINKCILSSIRDTVCHSLMRNGGLDLRRCAAVPTASMYYSNLPLESEEAKSRREVEALLLQRILEKNRASNEQSVSSSSSQSCAASVDTESSNARPQAVNALAIQRLLLNLAGKDLDVVSKQETGAPFLFNQKTPSMLPETSGSSHSTQNSLHQSSLMTSVLSQHRRSHYPSVTNSVPASYPKSSDLLAEVTVTRKSPPAPKTSFREEDYHISSAIDLSKRPRLSSAVPTTSTRTNTPNVPALKPLTNFHDLSRSPSISSSSRESPMDLGLEERTRLIALFNEVKKVGACRAEGVSQDTGEFPSSPILTSSQIEVLLETLGRSRLRYRSTDP